jgi:uncharacterized protein YkwD
MIFAILGVLAIFGFVVYSMNENKRIKIAKVNYKPIEDTDLTPFELEMVRLFNVHRKSLGLKEVIPEVLASEICKEIILYNIENELPPHHKGWEKRVEKCKAVSGGEICNSNLNTPYGFFTQYLTSKLHKDCIENPIYTHIGICVFEKRNYCIFTKYENN